MKNIKEKLVINADFGECLEMDTGQSRVMSVICQAG